MYIPVVNRFALILTAFSVVGLASAQTPDSPRSGRFPRGARPDLSGTRGQAPGAPGAPTTPPPADGEGLRPFGTFVTHHTITLHGQPLDYTATAGVIPIKSDEGEVEGQLFYVAYTKDGADPATRPVTFAYNGGPGSSSIFVHLGALGPRRVAMNDDGSMPQPPFHMVDNQETWLGDTDVVIVDAMGTGYSRLAKPDYGRLFYSVQGDIAAYGQFISSYLGMNRRFVSPVFLAGESYGGIRTAGLAGYLIDHGIALNGATIISGVENYLTLSPQRGNDVPYITYFPTYATTAWYHKRLSRAQEAKSVDQIADEAEKFAFGDYANALLMGTEMPKAQYDHIVRRAAELTGLSETFVRQSHLRIAPQRYFKELLRDKGLTIGRYDGRLTATDALEIGDRPEFDPSDAAVTPVFNSMAQQYLPTELGIKTDLEYRLNNYGGGPWDFGTRNGYADTSEDLRRAFAKNPYMKLMFVCGRYDLACPFGAAHFTVNHMDLNPSQLANVSFAYFPAGHMVYIERSSREKLQRDVSNFYRSATTRK